MLFGVVSGEEEKPQNWTGRELKKSGNYQREPGFARQDSRGRYPYIKQFHERL
jgi:hypothetical protein